MITQYRTDIASEALGAEKLSAPIPGLNWARETLHGLPVISVEIRGQEASRKLSKPEGLYFTLDIGDESELRGESFVSAAKAIAQVLQRCFSQVKNCCLIAALGNPDITPDAIGPLTASNVLVTKHLKEQQNILFENFSSVALCRTGVLGTSGIESARQIKSLCRELEPDFVIAIDALAGNEADKLCRSVQISTGGIAPGSGVKNDRMELNGLSLGVPVIAVGVPTVIDAGSLCGDKKLSEMFVTPRGIDSQVRSCAKLIGYGINLALHKGITVTDIDMLVG